MTIFNPFFFSLINYSTSAAQSHGVSSTKCLKSHLMYLFVTQEMELGCISLWDIVSHVVCWQSIVSDIFFVDFLQCIFSATSPRKVYDTRDSGNSEVMQIDFDDDKYRRRPALSWFAQVLKWVSSVCGSNSFIANVCYGLILFVVCCDIFSLAVLTAFILYN